MQTEFLKNVRQNISQAQQKATARLESLNGDAKKIFTNVVEKGKASQKDLSAKLEKSMKPAAETAAKRLSEVSREQAVALAGGLRKVAARLDEMAKPAAETSTQIH